MSVEITKRPNLRKLSDEIKKRVRVGVERAAEDALTEIQARTLRGEKPDGGGFVRYSPGYERFKASKGRSTKPNLNFTGNMLKAMRQKVTVSSGAITAKLFFGSALEAAKAKGNMQYRRFFALSREQVKRITQKIKDAINANR